MENWRFWSDSEVTETPDRPAGKMPAPACGTGSNRRRMEMAKYDKFGPGEAKRVGDIIGVNWKKYPLEEFRMGLHVELEHGARDSQTNVTDDDIIMTGKIALAHLKEIPDYYTRLDEMEEEGERYWERKKKAGAGGRRKGRAKAAKPRRTAGAAKSRKASRPRAKRRTAGR